MGHTLIFHKAPLAIPHQIQRLMQRGMEIADVAQATHDLTHINYYRLRAYWLPFEIVTQNDTHQFQANTKFSDVIALYQFDRELRLLLLDAIERIEISLRSRWANYLAVNYGAFAHHNPLLFHKQDIWKRCCDALDQEFLRSHETFAKHYQENYPHLATPPIWVACELLSIGHLSRWIHNLRKPHDRQEIANLYGVDEMVLISFLHHLTIVRNHCAHHGRVWNRRFTVKMRLPNKKPMALSQVFNRTEEAHGRLYNTLAMLVYLLKGINPESLWRNQVMARLKACSQASTKAMGFPDGWQYLPLWSQ